ncbi:MAG: 5-(carboxyamino)imidazole ribonucleotide mutase [Erysipelotrichia bacterium]|nr:5-(carboxyamino)imidazole ribonucleotide mutase [Erysipelotrichia bacterium]
MSDLKKAAVIMGSDSDWPTVKSACIVLKQFGVPFDAHVISAHRTPEAAITFAKHAEENGYGVIICAAGMAAHLAGAFAANCILPVIGIPMKGGACDGLDALLATVQMPSGYTVATVALNGAKNAAYLAVSILALNDEDLKKKLRKFREDTAAAIMEKDIAVFSEAASL